MLINANSNTNRTEILQNKYLELLNSGIEAEKILVLVQNSKKKKEFVEKIKKKSENGFIGSLKICSFWGLIREYILENWAIVENSLKDNNAKIIPYLSGLEISQYIFKKCIEEVDFTGYNSKTSLLHQLFRRNSLINLNNLSKEEINKRDEILQQTYSNEANQTINKYKAKTIDLRAFDYIRQINIFEFLYKKIENNFEYVFVDDADAPPAQPRLADVGQVDAVADVAVFQVIAQLGGSHHGAVGLALRRAGAQVRRALDALDAQQLLAGEIAEIVRDLAAVQRSQQRVVVHQLAAGKVQHAHTVLAHGQRLRVDGVARRGQVGHVHGQIVAPRQHIAQRHAVLHAARKAPRGVDGDVRVVAQHLHAQRHGGVGHPRADGPKPDDAQRFAAQLRPDKLFFAFFHLFGNGVAAF